jgi:outer membrane protein assembly factor BamB
MGMSRSSCALLIVVLLLAPAVTARQDAPEDYPQWRGRDRDGSASAFAEPVSWPDTLTRRWRVEVGEGYATPIVVGGTVYAFTRRGDREGLTAIDAATGTERWRSDYTAPYTPGSPAAVHGAGPKATPLFHEGKLFTLGISGIVAAWDPEGGRLLWRTDQPSEPPYFSAASSPVGGRGLVIVHPGNYEPLTAFDANDGSVKWVAGDAGFFMSPTVVELAGVQQAVTVTQKAVIGVSVADGRLLWQYPWPGGGAGGTMPIVYGETILASASGMGVIALRPIRQGDSWDVELIWETKDVSMYISNPVVVGDALFGLSQRASGQFFALDAGTGDVLWLGFPREAANTAVAKAGDLLFLLNDDAELIVARANPPGLTVLKRYTVADSATWAQPAISGQRFFIKDGSTLALWTLE